jgi:hypothetical protein
MNPRVASILALAALGASAVAGVGTNATSAWKEPRIRPPRDNSPGLDGQRLAAAKAKRARRAARNLANSKKGGAS